MLGIVVVIDPVSRSRRTKSSAMPSRYAGGIADHLYATSATRETQKRTLVAQSCCRRWILIDTAHLRGFEIARESRRSSARKNLCKNLRFRDLARGIFREEFSVDGSLQRVVESRLHGERRKERERESERERGGGGRGRGRGSALSASLLPALPARVEIKWNKIKRGVEKTPGTNPIRWRDVARTANCR